MRRQLEDILRRLYLVHDEIGVTSEAARSEGQPEIANVLSLCVCNRLFSQLKLLTDVIERLGGRTDLSEEETAQEPVQVQARILRRAQLPESVGKTWTEEEQQQLRSDSLALNRFRSSRRSTDEPFGQLRLVWNGWGCLDPISVRPTTLS